MKHLKDYFWSMACLLMMGAAMVSCDDDNNDNGESDGEETDSRVAYILYEGMGGYNNSGIARFSPSGASDFVGNFFYTQNQFGLGDTAMSFDEENGNLYCVVSGSKNVVRMDRNCVEQVRHSFDASEGAPRYLVVEDGYVYVTQYGGKVSKLDATTLEEVASFKGGDNLEGIAEHNGKLYVANAYKYDGGYVYHTEVLVIDAASMQLDRSLEVTINPEILKEIDDKIFLISRGDYGMVQPTLQVINPSDNSVSVIGNASKITEGKNDRLYVLYSNTTYDENWNATTVNTYFTYNMQTGQVENTSFLKNAPAELGSGNVYLLEMDEETEEIYVGLTDYVTNGTIYRFDGEGNLMETFDAGGINPNSVLFVEND